MTGAGVRVRESAVRRIAQAVLIVAVRGRRERGGEWGEAVLGEFAETTGDWEAVRWAAGGLRAAWRERTRALPLAGRAIAVLAIAVVAGLAVNQWVLTVATVHSGSMENTLLIGDRYLVDKVGFHLTGLHRGDVVEIQLPGVAADSTKRVIGLPGDTIACQGGRVLVNGSFLDEPYLQGTDSETDCTAVTVPAGHLYVLGDHRIVSLDSQRLGPLPASAVHGRLVTKLWSR